MAELRPAATIGSEHIAKEGLSLSRNFDNKENKDLVSSYLLIGWVKMETNREIAGRKPPAAGLARVCVGTRTMSVFVKGKGTNYSLIYLNRCNFYNRIKYLYIYFIIFTKNNNNKTMIWESLDITNDNGAKVKAVAPVIISASRSTDIPAFYADWFFNRLKIGHSAWINPFNGVKSYISYKNTRLIVFWSKNPEPLLKYTNELTNLNINSYIQFTLNDYSKENVELGVSPLDQRIETFIKLSEKIGKGKVIWRFDPLLLTNKLSIDELLKRIEYIGNQIYPFNEHFVFSFIDIDAYKKVASNLAKTKTGIRELSFAEKIDFASELRKLNQKWGFSIGTCAEQVDLDSFDIQHNKCIDEQLIINYFSHDKKLMDFIGVKFQMPDIFSNDRQVSLSKSIKDKGQREFCGCIISKDIGQYNTCPHLCEYCYANNSKELAQRNYKHHLENTFSETITGL